MEISIESTEDFERLICVVEVSDRYGLLISEEAVGQYMATVCYLAGNQSETFFQRRNVPADQLPVQDLLDAVSAGVERLKAMDRPRSS